MAAILFMCRTGPLALLPVRSLAANPAGRAEFVQQHRLELIEQARLGPLVQPPRSGVVGLAAAAGCVVTAPRAAVGPRDWSWPGASQHQPESLKQP